MYVDHWRLRQVPFRSDADPAFFFRSDTHQAALLKLRFAIESAKPLGLLIGETGMGKSALLQVLGQECAELGPFAMLRYPQLDPFEFLAWTAAELGVPESAIPVETARHDVVLRLLEERLRVLGEQGQHAVIVVEDAHLIRDGRFFETLRLLLNLADAPGIRFTFLLAGEPALLAQMQRLGPLEERIDVRALVRPLTTAETAAYVEHRLRIAGREDSVFDTAALELLHERTGGVPRRINRVCDMGLLIGYAEQADAIGVDAIHEIADEVSLALAE